METNQQTAESMLSSWYDSAETPDTVTIQEFDAYVEEYLAERKKADDLDDLLTAQNKKIMSMQGKLIAFLDLLGKKKHVVPQGTIVKVDTTSWKAPEGELRENVIEYLRERNQMDNVMAFNAKKFSSWYDSEREANPEFSLVGVEQSASSYIKFNKNK